MTNRAIIAVAGLLALAACAAPTAAELMPADAARPLPYSPTTADMGELAVADVACEVEANGHTTNCRVLSLKGNPAFAAPALEYALAQPYTPPKTTGEAKGPPTVVMHVGFPAATKFLRTFSPAQPVLTPDPPYPAGVTDGTQARVRMRCTILATGYVGDCTVLADGQNPAFTAAALSNVSKFYYTPAWRHGHFVVQRQQDIAMKFYPPFPNQPPPPPKDVIIPRPAHQNHPPFPEALMPHGTGGKVLIICDLGADGVNRNCVIGGIYGDPAAGPAGLEYFEQLRVFATRAGRPVAVPHKGYTVTYGSTNGF